VEARGPLTLESVVRLYNNGYYGASWVNKGRVYIKEGQEAPAGMHVKEGPRGGRYYESEGATAKDKIMPKSQQLWDSSIAHQEAFEKMNAAHRRGEGEAHDKWERIWTRLGKKVEALSLEVANDTVKDWLQIIRQELRAPKSSATHIVVDESGGFRGGAYIDGDVVLPSYAIKDLAQMRRKPSKINATGFTSFIHELVHSFGDDPWATRFGGLYLYLEEGLTDALTNALVTSPSVVEKFIGMRRSFKGSISYASAPVVLSLAKKAAARHKQKSAIDFVKAWKFNYVGEGRFQAIKRHTGLPQNAIEDALSETLSDYMKQKMGLAKSRWPSEQGRIRKGRVYLKEGQEAPAGMPVVEGPRGGRYYYTAAGRGRPLSEAPKGWMPKEGERVRVRYPGSRYNGRLAKVVGTTIETGTGFRGGDTHWATVEGIGDWKGGGYYNISKGQLVPAPYTAKEKKDLTARDILVQEFGKTSQRQLHQGFRTTYVDDGLEYNAFKTEAGPELWIRTEPAKDKPWMATKESAVSMEAFLKALPEMSTEALQAMKDNVRKIIFSPVGNPTDRKTSQQIGSKFTSAASMIMMSRIMHIYPKSKGVSEEALATVLTHETGHALDDEDSNLSVVYNHKRREFWADKPNMPTDDASVVAIEEAAGIPPHPRAWMDGWGAWRSYDLGTRDPDAYHYWRVLREEKPWNALSTAEQIAIRKSTNGTAPVSKYANTNEREYYAEAYAVYQEGRLPETHIMHEHFKNIERTRRWAYDAAAVKEESVPWPAD